MNLSVYPISDKAFANQGQGSEENIYPGTRSSSKSYCLYNGGNGFGHTQFEVPLYDQ